MSNSLKGFATDTVGIFTWIIILANLSAVIGAGLAIYYDRITVALGIFGAIFLGDVVYFTIILPAFTRVIEPNIRTQEKEKIRMREHKTKDMSKLEPQENKPITKNPTIEEVYSKTPSSAEFRSELAMAVRQRQSRISDVGMGRSASKGKRKKIDKKHKDMTKEATGKKSDFDILKSYAKKLNFYGVVRKSIFFVKPTKFVGSEDLYDISEYDGLSETNPKSESYRVYSEEKVYTGKDGFFEKEYITLLTKGDTVATGRSITGSAVHSVRFNSQIFRDSLNDRLKTDDNGSSKFKAKEIAKQEKAQLKKMVNSVRSGNVLELIVTGHEDMSSYGIREYLYEFKDKNGKISYHYDRVVVPKVYDDDFGKNIENDKEAKTVQQISDENIYRIFDKIKVEKGEASGFKSVKDALNVKPLRKRQYTAKDYKVTPETQKALEQIKTLQPVKVKTKKK